MKSVIKVYDMGKSKDVIKVQSAISVIEGIIACEISLEKKEIQVIYNENFVDLDSIITSIENVGYIVLE